MIEKPVRTSTSAGEFYICCLTYIDSTLKSQIRWEVPFSKLANVFMSSESSSKSKTFMFSWILDGVALLGIAAKPLWSKCRRRICAGVFECFFANFSTIGLPMMYGRFLLKSIEMRQKQNSSLRNKLLNPFRTTVADCDLNRKNLNL